MNMFGEVREVRESSNSELKNKINGFENTKKDVTEPRRVSMINNDLEGKRHPFTDVPYRSRTFRLNGETVEGVFPVFKSKFDTMLPENLQRASDSQQFKYCTERLRQRIRRDPEFAKQFTPRQREQIENGAPRISGYTWHHNEFPGKMQLVDASIHDCSGHTGGRNIWGGGSGAR